MPESTLPVRPDRRTRWLRVVSGLSADRVSAAVFGAALIVALPVLRWTNRQQWFFLDEWDFLAGRSLSSPGDLLRPHNSHWATLPIIVYRVLFGVFGLNHYWPYQAVIIAVHLLLAVAMREVMRRAGADPWISTALAVLFVFFGSGRANIGWAFQMGFAGSVLLGFGQMLAADHNRGIGRRDAVALLLGLASIMTHGPGVAMVMGTGAMIGLRRGWRAAALQVVPLGAIFLAWAVLEQPAGEEVDRHIGGVARFAALMPVEAFEAIAQNRVFAVLFGLALLVGLLMLVRRAGRAVVAEPATICVGPMVAALAFALLTAWGRAGTTFSDGPGASRYMHVMTVLLLPALAVAATELVRNRAPWWRFIAVVLLLVGLPANVGLLRPQGMDRFTLGRPAYWSTLAQAAHEGDYPASHRPEEFEARDVTVGWLVSLIDDGRIPLRRSSAAERANARAALVLGLVENPGRTCRKVAGQPLVRLEGGDALVVDATRLTVGVVVEDNSTGIVTFLSLDSERLAVGPASAPVTLRLQVPSGVNPRVCN